MAAPPSERPEQVMARSRTDTQPKFLNFPLNIGAHSVLLVFNKYTFIPPGERGLNKLSGGGSQNRSGIVGPVPIGTDAIQLPLPANLQDSYSLRVSGNELGTAAAEVAGAASAFSGSGDLSAGNLAGVLKSAIPDINVDSILNTDMGQISRNISFLGRRSIDNLLPGAGRAIDQGLGNTVNPKASLFFEGVNLKQFDFNWTLAPTDSTESDRIRDISNTVKRHILPTYGNAVGLNRVLLNYPSTVDIFFLGIEDSYFFHYKTCMVQQFQTNYTPNGLAIVAGGKPAMVTMNMTLMEMDIHTSEDYGGTSTDNETATTEQEIADAAALSGGAG